MATAAALHLIRTEGSGEQRYPTYICMCVCVCYICMLVHVSVSMHVYVSTYLRIYFFTVISAYIHRRDVDSVEPDEYVVVLGGPKGTAYSVQVDLGQSLEVVSYIHMHTCGYISMSNPNYVLFAFKVDVTEMDKNHNPVQNSIVDISHIHWRDGQPLIAIKFNGSAGDENATEKADSDGDDDDLGEYFDEENDVFNFDKDVQYVQYEGRNDDGSTYKLKFNGSQQTVIVRFFNTHAHIFVSIPSIRAARQRERPYVC